MKEKDLIRAMKGVAVSSEGKARIAARVAAEQEGKARIAARVAVEQEGVRETGTVKMRRHTMKSKKRVGGLIAAAVLVLGVTAFAASGVVSSWYASSTSRPDYKVLPTAEQVRKDIGYDVTLIDAFSNGYTFKNGSIIKNRLEDEDGKAMESFKSVDFRYEKGGDEVDFSQDRYDSVTENAGAVVDTVDGIDLWYHSYVNKLVPPDYELTAEDKKAEENGDLVFSYGSDEVEIITWQSVSWTDGATHGQLFQQVDEQSLSQDELIAMAKEAIAG